MPEPCCGFSLLVIWQQQARRPTLCDIYRRGAGPAGKGDTPCVYSAIVVVAMVAVVVVAWEMAVACLTCPPCAVTSIIDARCSSALWERRREGGEDKRLMSSGGTGTLPTLFLCSVMLLLPSPHLSPSHTPFLLCSFFSSPFISHGCWSYESVH